MIYSKIAKFVVVLAALLLVGTACGQDWLEGGYVRSFDRSMFMDPGIAGMVRWLDAPVDSYPWYSSDVKFYKQQVPDTTFSPYKEYFTTTGTSAIGGIISNPSLFDITKKAPSSVYYGSGQGLPYSQYVSLLPTKSNDLWIQGTTNWTQYLVSPLGAVLHLVASVPVGGEGGFYEIIQTDTIASNYKTYHFYQGYNSMTFTAAQIGRHMLYFVVANQPSNVVVIDVFAQAPSTQFKAGAATTTMPTTYTVPQTSTVVADTPVQIRSQGMKGYQVFLDENYIGTEGTGGDVLDGVFSFKVAGGQSHNIRVYDGQFNYPKIIYFERGVQKIINVEPGTAVYI
ncbi:MAG: hypothetical protein GYA39_06290 [Methanothrix sp.]|nr:hypothetical protein [Methanothrix sp.]